MNVTERWCTCLTMWAWFIFLWIQAVLLNHNILITSLHGTGYAFIAISILHCIKLITMVFHWFSSVQLLKSLQTTNTIQEGPCSCQPFLEPHVSLPYFLQLVPGPYPGPKKFSPHPPALFT
jgi:hypothetical protein